MYVCDLFRCFPPYFGEFEVCVVHVLQLLAPPPPVGKE